MTREPACPFDPDLSDRPTQVIPVDQIVDLLRVPHAHDRIRMYRKAMEAGDRFPPISVVRLGRIFIIADGHKRFVACSELGLDDIEVELWGIGTLCKDLLAQMWSQIRKGATVISRLHHGPKARRRACWYFLSFFYHWKRMFKSFRRSPPPTGAGIKKGGLRGK